MQICRIHNLFFMSNHLFTHVTFILPCCLFKLFIGDSISSYLSFPCSRTPVHCHRVLPRHIPNLLCTQTIASSWHHHSLGDDVRTLPGQVDRVIDETREEF